MKQVKLLFLLLFSAFLSQAQITGVKTIPGDYPTLTAAVNDLNIQGVGAGGATFNVATGYTETLTAALVLTMTTNAPNVANPLLIQKSGGGANPLITAYAGTTTNLDGMFILNGVDYVTINGIDLQENVTNVTATTQMEWGYALLKTGNTNGAQRNTIKNCTITLNKANTASVAIYLANHTTASTTALTVSLSAGANSYNKLYNNTVQNCYIGISVTGYASAAPFDLYDQANEIGIDGISPNPNQVLNFGGGALTVNGIVVTNQNKVKIFNTTINNSLAAATSGTLNGISLVTGTNSDVDVYNNTITLTHSGTASTVMAINNTMGGTGAGNTVNIYGNTVTACTNPLATTMEFRGISSTATASFTNMNNNTVSSNTLPGTGQFSAIYYGGGSSTLCLQVNLNNNTINGNTKSGTAGTFYCIYASASTVSTSCFSNQIFNNSNATSAGGMYGYYNFQFSLNENIYSNVINNNTGGTGETIMLAVQSGSGPTTKEVYSNTISNISASPTGSLFGAILIDYGTICNIYKNNIFNITNTSASGTTPAVYGISIGGNVNTQVAVYNNTISELKAPNASNVNAVYGIWLQGAATSNIGAYYNSVYLNASSVGLNFGSAALVCGTAAVSLDLRNNILVNNSTFNGTGITRALVRGSAVQTNYNLNSGYNCLYAGIPGASNLIYTDGTNNIQTLQLFKNLVGPREQSSFSELPPFINVAVSPYNLHLQAAIATQCENGARPIAGYTTDLDGAVRDANTPDVGADEFGGITTDIASPNIQYTLLGSGDVAATRVCTGFAAITDPSNINIAIGTKPRLYFKKTTHANTYIDNTSGTDGWKFVEATNSGSPFNFTINYALLFGGGGVIAGDLIQYFVTAQDLNVPPRIGLNNGGYTTQPLTVNLAAGNFPLTNTINQYPIVGTGLTGVVTVPGTYPSLTNVGGLFDAINNGTVTGNITAQITADLLAETGTVSLNQWSETGAGNYTLSIVPSAATQRTIAGSNLTNALIRLTGADRVTIDGRFGGSGTWLTFRNTSNSAPTVGLLNDAQNNTITYCILEGGNTTTTLGNQGGTVNIGNTTALLLGGNDDNTISFCEIRDRSDLIATPAIAIMSQGYSTGTLAQYNNNVTISNNNIHDWFLSNSTTQYGISLALGTSNYTISGNSFYQSTTRTNTISGSVTRAINIANGAPVASNGGFVITDNFIGGSAPGANGTDWVLNVTGLVSHTFGGINVATGLIPNSIQNNTIRKIDYTTTPTAAATVWFGINLGQGIHNVGNLVGNTVGSGIGQDHIKITINANAAVNSFLAGILAATTTGSSNIQNNIIGGITINGTTIAGGIIPQWIQIQGTPAFATTISNNLIGSLTTANSIRNLALSPVCLGFGVRYLVNTAAPLICNNNTIQNIQDLSANTASGFYGLLLISSVGGTNALTITNNVIKNQDIAAGPAGPALVNMGIAFQNLSGSSNIISNNSISNLFCSSPAGLGYVAGVQIQGSSFGGTLSKNKIWDLKNASSNPSAGIAGMYFNSGLNWDINNNMISLNNTGFVNDVQIWGINEFMNASSTNNLRYNSIYIGGTAFGFNNTSAYQRSNSSILTARNNIFYNERTGGAGNHYGMVSNPATTAGLSSDYNTFITADSTKVAGWGLTANNLSAWQSNTAGDANSLANNNTGVTSTAMYVATGTGDLHLNTSPFSVNRGLGGQPVTVDYDNETRATTSPAMGADEKPCAGIPTAGTLTATNLGPVCVSLTNDTLTLAGYSNASGIFFQFQSSTDGLSFTNVGLPTSRPYLYTGPLTDTMWYKVIVTCSNSGLTAPSNTIQINVSALPAVTASVTPGTTVCPGTAITLTGGGAGVGATYTWTDGVNIPLNNTPYVPLATATYTVTGTNTAGCSSTASIAVTVSAPPALTASATPSTICAGSNSQLNTSPQYTNNYILSSIPFAPPTPSGAPTVLQNAGITVQPLAGGSLDDGTWTVPLPVGFAFSYYGIPQTTLDVSTNGFIGMNGLAGANGCCSGQVLPNAVAPNNVIAMAWEDWNQTAGTMDVFVNGVAPNRQFVIRAQGIPRFGGTGAPSTAMIVLNETSNTIEMHLTSVTAGVADFTTQGIENATGTLATVVPLRNSTVWSATNEGWLFTPPLNPGTTVWTPSGTLNNANIPNPVATPATTTTYTVTVTNGAGCTASTTQMVTVNPAPTVTATSVPSPAIICAGSSLTLNGAGTAISYVWSGGVVNGVAFAPLTSGVYTVTGTDAGGCTASNTINVTVNPLPVFTSISATPPVICAGENSQLNAAISTLTNASLLTPAAGGNGSAGNVFDITATNTITIQSFSMGITSGTSAEIWYKASPYGNANVTSSVGYTLIGSVPITPAGPSPLLTAIPLPVNITIPAGQTYAFVVVCNGANYYTNGVAVGNPWASNADLVLKQGHGGIGFGGGFGFTNSPRCFNGLVNYSVGVPLNTVQWTPNIALTNNAIVNPVANPTTTTTYTLTGTDANGCSASSSVLLTVNPTPPVTASASVNPVCTGLSTILTGGGAVSYVWSGGVTDGVAFVPLATTTYTVTGTSASSCTATSTITITVNPLPSVSANPLTQTVCENAQATINGTGATSYMWTGGITDGVPFTVTAANVYTVTGTDGNGCENTATAEVLMNAAPVINATITPASTCDMTSVNACATGGVSYVWTGGLNNCMPSIVTVGTNTYTVTGTDGAGCTGTSSVTITVTPASGTLAPSTSNQTQDHGDDFNINYYDASCDLIATVDDGAGGNVLGLTTSTVNVDATAGFHNGQPYVRRWYQIMPTANGAADVKLYINQSDFDDYNAAVVAPYLPLPTGPGDAAGIANIRITKNDNTGFGNNPIVITPTVAWTGAYWELSFSTPGFSQFHVHSVNPGNVPLPVAITSFSGMKLETSDKLSWITNSEHNNAYFNLQHSTDGSNFTTIAKVNSKAAGGNSNTTLNYSTLNPQPSLGHNYYRLQQVDMDNKVSVHAQIVDLIWGANGNTVSIYPNPTTDMLNIDLFATKAQNTTVKLLDMSGRVIKQIQAKSAVGLNSIKLSLGEIANGVYTIQIYDNNQLSHTSKVRKND